MFRPAPASIRTALLALAMAVAPLAHAGPDEGSDAMAKLLADKGLIDAPVPARSLADKASALGQQMRNTTSELVLQALTLLGVPYKRGGNSSETGFDCSGFTRHLFENTFGLLLPRRVDEQAKASGLVPVKRDELKPGDLVFFNTLKRTFSHVGIYVGDDKFIHAPNSGSEVRVESLSVKYWAKRFTGARRAALAAEAPASASATTASAKPFSDHAAAP